MTKWTNTRQVTTLQPGGFCASHSGKEGCSWYMVTLQRLASDACHSYGMRLDAGRSLPLWSRADLSPRPRRVGGLPVRSNRCSEARAVLGSPARFAARKGGASAPGYADLRTRLAAHLRVAGGFSTPSETTAASWPRIDGAPKPDRSAPDERAAHGDGHRPDGQSPGQSSAATPRSRGGVRRCP